MSTHSQSGFSLVELAIVLVIIGLLIGGVLKGKEMIENSRVVGTIQQVRSISAAVKSFRGIYKELPGDIPNAGARLPNCTSSPCNIVGYNNGNGFINSGSYEPDNFWRHLSKTNLLENIKADASGINLYPQAPISSESYFYVFDVPANPPQGHKKYGNLLQLLGPDSDTGLTPLQASKIDKKMDDGIANSGSVIVFDNGASIPCSTSGIYNETQKTTLCDMGFPNLF